MAITIYRPDAAQDPDRNRIILFNDLGDVIRLICTNRLQADLLKIDLDQHLINFTTTIAERN